MPCLLSIIPSCTCRSVRLRKGKASHSPYNISQLGWAQYWKLVADLSIKGSCFPSGSSQQTSNEILKTVPCFSDCCWADAKTQDPRIVWMISVAIMGALCFPYSITHGPQKNLRSLTSFHGLLSSSFWLIPQDQSKVISLNCCYSSKIIPW